MNHQILIVDDDRPMCGMLQAGLNRPDYEITTCTDASAALQLLREREFACVITDVRMGTKDGIELCREALQLRPQLPVIVVTAFGSIQTAILAIRAGAFEFLTKPFELDTMRRLVARAIEHHALTQRVQALERSLQSLREAPSMVGSSAAVRQLQQLIERAGPSDVAVLIQGESGTGKELTARMIHEASGRRDQPFVAINCAALPENLLESELFGHVRGAFTDAKSDRKGLFTQAGKGTIFLDEIGELPLNLQPKLLRVLQERTLRPIGGRSDLPFEARVITATNRNLEDEVREGRFREDLYYRVQVLQIDVPPLRVRGGDVLLLAQAFADDICRRMGRPPVKLSREFAEALGGYHWPGNVRELSNCIERAIALGDGQVLAVSDLPSKVLARPSTPITSPDSGEFVPLHEVERRYILRVVEAVDGNKSLAARMLGLNRKTLYRKLSEYGVAGDVESERDANETRE